MYNIQKSDDFAGTGLSRAGLSFIAALMKGLIASA